jgi:hypothetical protein
MQKTGKERAKKSAKKGKKGGQNGAKTKPSERPKRGIFDHRQRGFSIKKGARGGVFHFLCVSLAKRYHNKVYYNLIE